MQPIVEFLVFAAVICFGRAEIKLTQGMNTTVAFDGEELSIRLDNPQKQDGALKLCFKSTANAKSDFCPEGYVQVYVYAVETVYDFRINRQGQFFTKVGPQMLSGNVVFEDDGLFNIVVVAIPKTMTVTLVNAFIPVVTTTTATETTQKKESDKTAMIGIICGVSGLLLLLFIVGCVLLYFCWYKKRTHQPVPTAVAEAGKLNQTRDDTREIEEPQMPRIVVEIPATHRVKRPLKPSATTTTTTRKTSPSTTPASEEKPQAVVAPEQAPRTPAAQPSDVVSLISDATQMDESVVTPEKKTQKSKKASKKSKKSRRRRSKTPKKTPVKKQDSPSLPVDRTPSPTMPSTRATPDYPDDALADSSHYKKRDYLQRSEAPVPGSTQSRSRSRPIVHEVDDYKLQTESRSEERASQRPSSHDDHRSRQSEKAPHYLRRRTDPTEGRADGCSRAGRYRPRRS
uniref:Uncharacterized protein n=1 Tax=Panagrellus redivivus TaxID=6233 RepID=A0A7E4W323_PANRE